MNPQSREFYDTPKWKGYEVMLDLYPDVFAYGILLLPKDLKPGEKRPVVVCQHGLEGRPQDVCNPNKKTPYYNSFAAQLADRGYIVLRAAEPVHRPGQVPRPAAQGQPAQAVAVLVHRPPARAHARLALDAAHRRCQTGSRFYGLSYGGKTAMRVPAILPKYCLSICSADFNEWVWKNVSVDFRGSYMFTRRVRDARVRPGQHVQLRGDGRPDRPAAVHGRTRPRRRRRHRRDGRLRVRQGPLPVREPTEAARSARRSSSSPAGTRSTGRGRSRF